MTKQEFAKIEELVGYLKNGFPMPGDGVCSHYYYTTISEEQTYALLAHARELRARVEALTNPDNLYYSDAIHRCPWCRAITSEAWAWDRAEHFLRCEYAAARKTLGGGEDD